MTKEEISKEKRQEIYLAEENRKSHLKHIVKEHYRKNHSGLDLDSNSIDYLSQNISSFVYERFNAWGHEVALLTDLAFDIYSIGRKDGIKKGREEKRRELSESFDKFMGLLTKS